MLEDRKRLEALAGYPVRGFVLPFGWRSGFEMAKEFARACGFKYMRHTESAPHFEPPSDFLDWKPTCHCRDDLTARWRGMVDAATWPPGRLFYVWGHSYEFEDHQAWGPFEAFAATVQDTPGVWNATKGDLYDYIEAWRRLEWSLDGTMVRNPSACSVWFWRKNKAVCVGGGDSLRMD